MKSKGIMSLLSEETLQAWADKEVGKDPVIMDYLGYPELTAVGFYSDRVKYAERILLKAYAQNLLGLVQAEGVDLNDAQRELEAREHDLEVATRVESFNDLQRSSAHSRNGKKAENHRIVSEEIWCSAEIRLHQLHQLHPNLNKKELLIKLEQDFPELCDVEPKTVDNRLKHPKNLSYTFDSEVFEENWPRKI